jgi:hypothetical protein
LHQYADKPRQIVRFKDQVTIDQAGETEKYQGDIEGYVMRPESEVRENLQLPGFKCS